LKQPRDFWLASGHHLLDRDADGRLAITDEFLKAYLARPEIAPPPEACSAERELHGALLLDPRLPVAPPRIAAIADADARENWELMIAWRDHLANHATLEASYLDIVSRSLRFPHLFIDQLAQVILRNILDGCDDPFVVRAAELFFRPQKLALRGSALVAADEEAASRLEAGPAPPLASILGLPNAAMIELIGDDNAEGYWRRSDMFDLALDLTVGGRGVAALGEVITRWIVHLLGIDVEIEAAIELRDAPLTWYIGLDAEATRLGDALWNGEEPGEAMRTRLVGFYRLSFVDPSVVIEKVRGGAIILLMAMTTDDVLRLKPQNLVAGLPIAQRETTR
jgi:hypothetical protein